MPAALTNFLRGQSASSRCNCGDQCLLRQRTIAFKAIRSAVAIGVAVFSLRSLKISPWKYEVKSIAEAIHSYGDNATTYVHRVTGGNSTTYSNISSSSPMVTPKPSKAENTTQFNAAFALLIKHEPTRPAQNKKILSLLTTLSSMWLNGTASSYPVHLFHDRNITSKFQNDIALCSSGLDLIWHNISELFERLQGNITQSERWARGLDGGAPSNKKSPSYRAMCQFWSNEVYRLPFIQNLDALVRLDDDSWFSNMVTEDPIHAMARDGRLRYGFSMYYRNQGAHHMSHNLLNHLREFAGQDFLEKAQLKRSNICPLPKTSDDKLVRILYNNFFITRPSMWNEGIIRSFYDHLQSKDAFLKDGIGDAEFHTAALCLLDHGGQNPDSFMTRFGADSFPYRHKNERASKSTGDNTHIRLNGKKMNFWKDYLGQVGCGTFPFKGQG